MPNTVSNRMSAWSGWLRLVEHLMGLVEQLALHLASRFIRVNCVTPTNVNTHLLLNDANYQVFRPDLENPTLEDAIPGFTHFQAMPIPRPSADRRVESVRRCSRRGRRSPASRSGSTLGSLIKFPERPRRSALAPSPRATESLSLNYRREYHSSRERWHREHRDLSTGNLSFTAFSTKLAGRLDA